MGYVVPGWQPVRSPFERACALLWRRVGAYTLVTGEVLQCHEAARLIWLGLSPSFQLWVSVPEPLLMPAAGERIRAVALDSWAGGSLSLLRAAHVESLGPVRTAPGPARGGQP